MYSSMAFALLLYSMPFAQMARSCPTAPNVKDLLRPSPLKMECSFTEHFTSTSQSIRANQTHSTTQRSCGFSQYACDQFN